MKQSPQLTEIQKNMRPGVITKDGLLGPDKRNLIDILIEDEAAVQRLNMTHQQIAEAMKQFRDNGKRGLGLFVEVDPHFEVKVEGVRGGLPSPFGEAGMVDKMNTIVKNLHLNRDIYFTDLHIHMIEHHGFYQGKGSLYRLEPKDIVDILEV
ncbi:hypothetical protein KAH37_08760 [bacterium]|nr:hypothetical protein [bacterium]